MVVWISTGVPGTVWITTKETRVIPTRRGAMRSRRLSIKVHMPDPERKQPGGFQVKAARTGNLAPPDAGEISRWC
jgi:hypothetical protein